MRALQDNGLIPITEAVGGKHTQGFAIAHVQEANVTGVGTGLGKDNHQGTPPLMTASATLSCASSWFNDRGAHEGRIREWGVRAAFFNADLDDIVHVHLGHGVCQLGHCWLLRKSFAWDMNALTRNGESGTVTSCDGLGWQGVSEKRLRIRFCEAATWRHAATRWTFTDSSGQLVGTKARGHGLRDSLGLLSVVRAKEVAGAGGTALYWSLDRWDTEKDGDAARVKAERPDECQITKDWDESTKGRRSWCGVVHCKTCMPNAMLIELHIGVELEIDQRRRSQARIAHMALLVCHVSRSGSE